MNEPRNSVDHQEQEVQVETAKEVTTELVDAVKHLTPYLGSVNQVEITLEYVKNIIDTSSNSLLVARNAERKITGMAVLVIAPTLVNPRAFLETLVVDPDARRQGVAKAIVEQALKEAEAKGVNTLRVSTGVDNEASNRLFESLGGVKEKDYLWYDFVISVGPQSK